MKPTLAADDVARECPDLKPGDPLDDHAKDWLRRRIQSLRSKASSKGPFRTAGIQRTIAGMKSQLRDGIWRPHGVASEDPKDVD